MTTITESQWVNYFGFKRFPFDRPEAGNEEFARPDFLAPCFVEPKSFERVFGQADAPVTSILFAARGTGKTACRVMMDYYCLSGLARLSNPRPEERYYVLSVPHIRLEHVREIARQLSPGTKDPQITVEHHAEEILRQAVPVFVDMIARVPEFGDNIKTLSEENLQDLSSFVIRYSAYLSFSQARYLTNLGGFIGQAAKQVQPLSLEDVLLQRRMQASPLVHIERWLVLIKKLGIQAMYVLVDGVDELMESAEDPHYAYSLIRPLLTHLRLMDSTPHLALKFFLPIDEQPILDADPAFRKDRGFVIRRIEWGENDLIEILRERLNALRRDDYEIRDRTAAGFDALCVPDLRGDIEKNLVRIARGNPRRLMNLCSEMVKMHCEKNIPDQDDPYQLNRQDYEDAVRRFDNQLPATQKPAMPIPLQQDPAVFADGQIIDEKYEVRKILPKGGAGQVYCVYDPMFERMCALKVYDNSAISADSFKNEVRSLRKINHPNIVQIYDWGVLRPSKRLYLTSEFVDGHDLKFYTTGENVLPVNKSVEIILEVLVALEYIHPDVDRLSELQGKMREVEISEEEYDEYFQLREQGWLHRDIKPANLVLSDQGIKLIDFNIAAQIGNAGKTFTGTLGYMLPETGMIQWSTDGDLFATAIVLYELITGNHPYPDRMPFSDREPTDPRTYVAMLNPDFAQTLVRATSCDPHIRYHSARLFRSDLISLEGRYLENTDLG